MGDIYSDGGTVGYPTSLDTATTQVDATPTLTFGTSVGSASKINNLATAIINIETELGTNPSGSDSTVAARINGFKSPTSTADWLQISGGNVTSIGTPNLTSATSGDLVILNAREYRSANAADTDTLSLVTLNSSNEIVLGGNDVRFGVALIALGGGSAATLGTIGGSGPATAGQNTWMRWIDTTGGAFWVPAWK